MGTTPNEMFEEIVKTVAERLRPLGFTRRGVVLRITGQDTCGIVQFQRSTTNTRDRLSFTVNLGVVCGELLEPNQPNLRQATIVDAHLQERIGMLLADERDMWWEITPFTDPSLLVREIAELILTKGVPYIQRYLSVDAIIALWESGQSPGLTNGRRVNLLAALKAKQKDGGA